MKFLQENYSVMLCCYEALMTVHFSLLHCHGLIAIHIKIQNYGVIEGLQFELIKNLWIK